MKRLVLLKLFLLLIGFQLFAQNRLDFDKLSMEDGFTASRATSIIQDRKGFIWIGTWNGLNRYDGYTCKILRPSYHDSTTISNREVVKLMEDHDGNIWIGTSSGLNRLNPSTRELKRYDFSNRIISLCEDNDHFIWVGTWNGGLFKLDPLTGEKKHYLNNEIVSDIYEDSRNMLWVATYNGLINFDRATSGYVRYMPNNESDESAISHSVITQIVESKDGNLWVSTWGGGINRIIVNADKDRMRFIHYTSTGNTGSLTSNVVYRLYYDDYGNLWAGTWNAGLCLLDKENQQKSPDKAVFYKYQSDLSDPYSLSGNHITALCVDRSGELWVGSSQIDRTNILNTGIVQNKTHKMANGHYVENGVHALEKDGRQLWIGTAEDLMLYKEENGQYKLKNDVNNFNYKVNNLTYRPNSIMSIARNDDGLWLGTQDAGLLRYPKGTDFSSKHPKFEFFNKNTSPRLPGNKVSNLFASKKYPHVLWIGTLQNGFAKMNYQHENANVNLFRAGNNEKALSDNNIRALLEDRNGIVWIGTQNGLNRFDPQTNTFKQFFYSVNDTASINDNVINKIYEDSDGNLWIGTNTGLNKKEVRVLPDGTRQIYFKGYPTIKYLSDEIVLNILEDDAHNLWLNFYRGLVQFNMDRKVILNEYFTKDIVNIVTDRNLSIKMDDGSFIVGGVNGFISFKPDSILKLSLPPKVTITDFQIFNESIDTKMPGQERYRLNQSIPYTDSIQISYKDEVVTFAFSAMDFKNPSKNKYAYFLDGFDKQWNEVGSRNTATYTNLSPGDYVFKVKAANSDGVWSKEPAIMMISIAPPWWKTIWAYLFYAIIIAGVLYFFKVYSFIKAREKGRLLIEHMKNEEEHRVNELKAHFLTDITHEFRTPLTLILGPARELTSDNSLAPYAAKQANLIKRNAHKMLRLVNQLMEFRKVEKGKMELFPQNCDITQIIDGIYDSFKTMAESNNIEFKVDYKTTDVTAFVDGDKFEKIMYNLFSNAFKYSEDGGQITVRVDLAENEGTGKLLVVEVEDTGIGIAEEHKSRVFERFFQANQKRTQSTGGIGLYLAKTLVEQHGGQIDLDSELGKGSCFKVIIPASSEAYESILAIEKSADSSTSGIPEDAIMQKDVEQDEKSSAENNNAPKVLIVEDDHDLNDFLISGLSSVFQVSAAYNGQEGLEQAKKIDPDIIITDIMMPELDGFELVRLLRKHLSTSHIPVVFLTAKTMQEDEIKGLKLGAVDYVYKPFNLVSLKLKIQNILHNRKIIRERIRTNQILEPENIELSSLDENFLKDAVDAVNKHLDDSSFDVVKFSAEVGISPNQAYRKIKALTGQTAKEFIRNQRLKIAANLLLQKKRSISEIIYMVGFSSPSYFTRCFKEYYGCTPKEYIENNGKVIS
ncbi:MAG TPA: two-component regulator propeller domain-containing protein [Sunxiuqinia sp.]|nr:two-component regulator propeller domain-containing protein [Sunxiuqinia sp.]